MRARLAEAFIESATRNPQQIALRCDGAELTYEELLTRASAVAAAVRDRVPANSLVALSLPKGIDVVVAMIATALAGCAYVPLDPAYPAERIQFCLDDCDAALVLGAGDPPADLGSRPYLSIDSLDAGGDAAVPLEVPAGGPSDAAYVIYTSGSTGRPKGVVVEHRNVLSMLGAAVPALDLGPDDVWTMFHSASFDFSVWEIWGALLHGARLVVVPDATARSPRDLITLLQQEQVTVFSQTPTAFQQISAAAVAAASEFPALRVVVFGGERLEPSSLGAWAQRYGLDAPRLVNMYGITETTVHATIRQLADADVAQVGRSPIGEPLDNLSITLVTPDGDEADDGEPGEMVLAGPGVTRGYLNRPELTAERFPTLPIGPADVPVRCYRSGDLARVDDGELVFLGRNDGQLKVRGYRIEPHEVELAIAACDGVQAAAVVAASAGAGDDRLVAFVVPAGPADTSNGALRGAGNEAEIKSSVARVLPDHMRPSHVYALDELPRTPSGKIDSAGLSERATHHLQEVTETPAESGGADADRESDAGSVAKQVIALGRRVLGIADLDPGRDIFDQGATSLAVVRFVAEINATFHVEVRPAQLAADSSLTGIGAVVEDVVGAGAVGANA